MKLLGALVSEESDMAYMFAKLIACTIFNQNVRLVLVGFLSWSCTKSK